jgi:hypothetical protein
MASDEAELSGHIPRGEKLKLPAHHVQRCSQSRVVRVEPFGSDRSAFVVIHAHLGAVSASQVPLGPPLKAHLLSPTCPS